MKYVDVKGIIIVRNLRMYVIIPKHLGKNINELLSSVRGKIQCHHIETNGRYIDDDQDIS